jgi:curved DNA-binding protein
MSQAVQKNYYELLGVARDASLDEIRDAYARKVRSCTPLDEDGIPEEFDIPGESQALLRVITAAYSTLTNIEKRAEYDRLLPKPIRSWDEEEMGWGRNWATKKILENPGESPYAFGMFGVVREERVPPSAFDLIQGVPVQPTKKGLIESLLALVRASR